MHPETSSLPASGTSRPSLRRKLAATAALALVPLALFGCRDPKVSVYRIPKEPLVAMPPGMAQAAHASMPSAAAGSAAPAGMAGATPASMPPATAMPPAGAAPAQDFATASGPGLAWTAPQSWQSRPAGMMRKATYALPGPAGAPLDLAIMAFPGDVGGEIANVNRWREQVGLEPLGPAEATASVQRIEANGLKIAVVDVAGTGTDASRLIGAMVPYQGATWFFKVMGPDAAVAAQKAALLQFLQTLKPAAGATP